MRVAYARRWKPAAADGALRVARKPHFGLSATAGVAGMVQTGAGFISLVVWLELQRCALGSGSEIVLCASTASGAVQDTRENLANAKKIYRLAPLALYFGRRCLLAIPYMAPPHPP